MFWLSFADDEGFLGACLVEAADMVDAVTRTHLQGINPGGEVKIVGPIPPGTMPESYPVGRLLAKAEIERLDRAHREATRCDGP